jgi:CSLREA domain-containing protein
VAASTSLLAASAASAETFTVTTTADGSGSCTSSLCTLREAVEAGNAASEPSTIVVPQGKYALTQSEAGSDLTIEGEMTIQGAGANLVKIEHASGCECRVLFINSPAATISGATISGGSTIEEGGDISFEPSGGGVLRLEADVISEGVSERAGGGIYVEEGALEMFDTTVSGNRAERGGGVFDENDSSEPAVLERDTFADNSAEEGGGIDIEIAEVSITNSTFNGNGSPTGIGGAILIVEDGNVSLLNDTLSGDIATPQTGGAEIHATEGQQLNIVNTIVGPAAAGLEGSECFLDISQTSESNIDAGNSCGFEASDGSLNETNPMLEPLAENGGPTKTMALKATSPAISAGSKAACPAIDQRGVTRPQPGDASCDIGAYEYNVPGGGEQPTPTPKPTPTPITTTKPATVCPKVKAKATSFKPRKRPGHVVPGVRVRLAAGEPSKLTVKAKLLWREAGKSRTAGLGSLAVNINRWRRVRFPLPASLRDQLPLGSPVSIKLRIMATPKGSKGCSATLTNREVNTHVVKVFPHAVQFERSR